MDEPHDLKADGLSGAEQGQRERGMNKQGMTDQQNAKARQVDLIISTLLRSGVVASMALVAVGVALMFAHHPEWHGSREALGAILEGKAGFPRTPLAVIQSAAAGGGQGLIVLGLLVLIATPVMRVAVSALAFFIQRDRVFVWITLGVLALLAVGFALGKVEG